VVWALRAYDACPEVNRLLLAVADEHRERAEAVVAGAGLSRPVRLTRGGPRRQDTVLMGLEALAENPPAIVAIHDGARPLIDRATIESSIDLARRAGACVTAAPVTDTIKRADPNGLIQDTPDRRFLWSAQTPQTFQFPLLRECYQRAVREGWEVTDDGSVVERCGHPVYINPGPPTNFKITTPQDLLHAEALMAASGPGAEPTWRVGTGYDVHRLVEGRRLILGGVHIPHEKGLQGHSDADVLLHAICDALLGAAAAGDIGKLFPDTDPTFKDADSGVLLKQVAEHVASMGCTVGNVDATIIAQRPKLAPYIGQMRENIAAVLGVDLGRVSVKATTTERLGFCGREEGIAAEAVVLLRSVRPR
jgi:2-C-methyl-D-erythritol 2,4-cyclodiphosphate synthase/2-C-methyl-D-erythritol 4-phosphate cytidylyltransferase